MAKRNAFTLAEVLITLGIIGVVAAMTLPTLLNSVQGSQYRAQLKKAMSSLSNALVMNVAQSDYDAGTSVVATASVDTALGLPLIFKSNLHVNNPDASYTAYNYTNAAKNQGGAAAGTATIGGANNYTFMMNDGSLISFPKTKFGCVEHDSIDPTTSADNKCFGIIDVNGAKNPNREAICDNTNPADVGACNITKPADVYPVIIEPQGVKLTTLAGQAAFGKGK